MVTRSFRRSIEPVFRRELAASVAATDACEEFRHLERAHVLGQSSTLLHVLAHVQMAKWAVRHERPRELFGQLLRVVGAATKTVFGWVPTGNTGGANVSPFKPLPIPADLAAEIAAANSAKR
jgi:Protein of unknown function (DUF3703)